MLSVTEKRFLEGLITEKHRKVDTSKPRMYSGYQGTVKVSLTCGCKRDFYPPAPRVGNLISCNTHRHAVYVTGSKRNGKKK